MSINLKLISAPYVFDVLGAGVIDDRRVNTGGPGEGIGGQRGGGAVIEAEIGTVPPEISGFGSGLRAVPIARGGARVFRMGEDVLRLSIPLDQVTGENLRKLRQLWQSGRLVAFHPWYDPTTYFMSTFGQEEADAGIAEIGPNNSTMLVRRSDGEHPPNRFGEDHGTLYDLGTNGNAKLVPGMTGNAILVESKRFQLMTTSSPSWSGSGGADVRTATRGSNPTAIPHAFFIPDGGGAFITAPGPTLTAAIDYTLSVRIRGRGTVQLVALHNGGLTSAHADDLTLDPLKAQEASVSWVQIGTTLTVLLTTSPSDSEEAIGVIDSVQVEAGSHPTTWIDPAASNPADPDIVKVVGGIPRGAGLTIALWWKKSESRTARQYFFSAYDSGASNQFYAYQIGSLIKLNLIMTETTGQNGLGFGEWEQLVFVVNEDGGGVGIGQTVYRNGEVAGGNSNTTSTDAALSALSDSFHVGSEKALPSGERGLDAPIDRFRIDGHAWNAQEVLDDYETLKESAIQTFLAHTQGRLFRIVGVPSAFQAGVFTDAMEGTLVLEQFSVTPAGIVS